MWPERRGSGDPPPVAAHARGKGGAAGNPRQKIERRRRRDGAAAAKGSSVRVVRRKEESLVYLRAISFFRWFNFVGLVCRFVFIRVSLFRTEVWPLDFVGA